jgi:hypothetical protein
MYLRFRADKPVMSGKSRRKSAESRSMTRDPQPSRACRSRISRPIDLVTIRVAAKAKPSLLRQLNQIGINRKYLFPDLEGLSEFVNWETRRAVHSRERREAKEKEPGGPSGKLTDT